MQAVARLFTSWKPSKGGEATGSLLSRNRMKGLSNRTAHLVAAWQEHGANHKGGDTSTAKNQERGEAVASGNGHTAMARGWNLDPQVTANAKVVLERRYLKKDDSGKAIESPKQLFERVARAIASADRNFGKSHSEVEKTAEKFYEMMARLEFMPNSPTLMNAGRELGQLSACFVLPVGDSMEEIFDAIKYTALIHKSGGGTGFSFSRLRPASDTVKSTAGVSSGPISFMEVFNAATETIKQGGTRRGANMGILRVDHPDILEFITSKRDSTKLTNFNISVALTDKFMKALETDEEYELVNPRSKKVQKKMKARKVFDMIVNMAWRNGEPGIIFLDRINRDNPTPKIGEIESTNPCGEQPLLPYESCNLGSINLARMLTIKDGRVAVDLAKLEETVHWSVRFLDNVIEVNKYPLPQIEHMTRSNRKIGLGVMGFADMLLRLGISYDSEDALRLGEGLMKFIDEEAHKASVELAEERGSFPNFPESTLAKRFNKIRNATVTTIAPTGTISIISGVSSGIEPIFAVAYVRNVMDKDILPEVNPIFAEIARDRGFYAEELMKEIAAKGTLKELRAVPEDVRRLFVTALDISPIWHIKMQAAFQNHTDNAVSKTVNFPKEATPKDVEDVYMLAYKLGCKGVTVYRYGSREDQVLSLGGEVARKEAEEASEEERARLPRARPYLTRGATQRLETGCGHLYVTINEDERGLCEVFTQMGKSGGCTASQAEAVGRLISLALRSGIEPEAIVKQLKGIRCPSPLWQPGGMVLSCSDAVAKALERFVKERDAIQERAETEAGAPEAPKTAAKQNYVDKGDVCPECPECGSMVEYVEGCVVCRTCGFSKCW